MHALGVWDKFWLVQMGSKSVMALEVLQVPAARVLSSIAWGRCTRLFMVANNCAITCSSRSVAPKSGLFSVTVYRHHAAKERTQENDWNISPCSWLTIALHMYTEIWQNGLPTARVRGYPTWSGLEKRRSKPANECWLKSFTAVLLLSLKHRVKAHYCIKDSLWVTERIGQKQTVPEIPQKMNSLQ